MRLSLPRCLLAWATLSANLVAENQPRNALQVLDAYLARAAAQIPAYRTDLRRGGDPRGTPPDRLFGFSSTLGPFTYRPMTYGELTGAQRAALLRDPKFRAFLVATRGQADRPPTWHVSLSPEEMLRLGPAFITLPPTSDNP